MKGTWDSFIQLLVAGSFLSPPCGWLPHVEFPPPDLRQTGRLVGNATDFGEGFLYKARGPPATWRAVMEPRTRRTWLCCLSDPHGTKAGGVVSPS